MTRVDVISNERVLDDRHHLHEFQDFWRDGPVALVFLPQFGSAFGLAQARELTARFDEVEALGAQVIGTSIVGLVTSGQSMVVEAGVQASPGAAAK